MSKDAFNMTTGKLSKLTSVDIFLFLRQRLLDAREQNDVNALLKLQTVFEVLLDLAYKEEIQSVGAILEDFDSSASDSITGVPWKSTIPSEETIRLALDGKEIDLRR